MFARSTSLRASEQKNPGKRPQKGVQRLGKTVVFFVTCEMRSQQPLREAIDR